MTDRDPTEGQALPPSYDLAPPTSPPLPFSHQQVVSLSQSFCVSPGDEGRGWGRSQITQRRESLVLKSFNTFWLPLSTAK